MKLKNRITFFTARRGCELTSKKERIFFCVWNVLLLVLSSAAITVLSLSLSIGQSDPRLFLGYFRCPLIFVLNWVPLLLLQLFLYFVFNRQWLAFLLSSSLVAAGSIGNFYKFQLRFEPFTFSDLGSIGAGLEVTGNYSLSPNSRVLLMVFAVLAGTVFLLLLARARSFAKLRIAGTLMIALSVWPLWSFVYSNPVIYEEKTKNEEYIIAVWSQQVYLSKGFVYPFIYSISESRSTPPAGYNQKEAAQIIAAYEDEKIPEDKRVHVMVLQIESYCDLRRYGLEQVDASANEVFDALAQDSINGLLVPNVMGGGTIHTEQSVITGSYGHVECKKAAPSYVHYMNSQGYFTTGGHPNRGDYYNRVNTNRYLGFQEYLFNENHYGQMTGGSWNCDAVMIPECFRLFKEKIQQGEEVFAFNVSLQNHSPYEAESLVYGEPLWNGTGSSEETYNMVNNYLGSLKETQALLLKEIESLREYEEPVVCLFYGDHKPHLGNTVYEEAGIRFDQSTAEGQIDYYSTPYYIWANDAAREITGNSFTGEGPTVSPGYIMGVLFEEIGWKGSAYMQFVGDIRKELPVVSTNRVYMVNGEPSLSLSDENRELLRQYESVQYLLNNSFKEK